MKKIFILLTLFAFNSYGQTVVINSYPVAQNYYVSSAGSGTGTQASPWGPSQLTSNLPTLPQGSTVYLNKGDVFTNFQINLTNTVKFDAYGTGANPVVTGSSDISGQTWTLDANNIYYTTMANEPKWLFIDGAMAKMAESAFITITGRPSTTQVSGNTTTLNNLNTTESLVGSYIIAKEWEFRPTYRRTVTAYSSGTITTSAPLETDLGGASTLMIFKLLNHKSYISAVGDWCYDGATQRLYVKTAGASPAGTDIKACFQDYGINISSGIHGVSIQNLEFKHQYLGGIYGISNSALTINACTFHDIIIEGLSVRGNSYNTVVTNNTLYNIANNAIHIGGVIGGNVSYNTIYNIGIQTGMSFAYYANTFRSVGCGIHQRWDLFATNATGSNVLMEYNNIHDVGYCGIVVVGTNHTVQKNIVYNYCIKWNDGAGIYVSGVYGSFYGNGSETAYNTVYHNIVRDGFGGARTIEGLSGPLYIEGIYVDNDCHDVTVDTNVVSKNANCGIKTNYGTKSTTITNNLVVDSKVAGIQFNIKSDWQWLTGIPGAYNAADDMICTGNTIVSKSNTQVCIEIQNFDAGSTATSYNPFANGGTCNNNIYISPFREKLASTKYGTNATTNTLYYLSEWQGLVYLTNDVASTNPFVRGREYVSQADADARALLTLNETTSTTNPTLSTSFYYRNEAFTPITTLSIPALSGKIAIQDFADNGTLLVNDQFTGSAGVITGRSPDLGAIWTVDSGTISLDGSGNAIASVTGEMYQDLTGNAGVTLEYVGQVNTNNSGMTAFFRFTNSTTRISVQAVIDASTSSNNKIIISNNASVLSTYSFGTTLLLNTDYRIKIRVNAGRVIVWFTEAAKTFDQVKTDFTSATIASNNASGVKHGLRINTVSKVNYCKIYGL